MKKLQSHIWSRLIALVIFPTLLCGAAGRQTAKPKLKVAADGLPGGHDTPEGVACDLARSSSIGMRNFSPPRPSDFTGAETGGRHMQNSFKTPLKVLRQKPPRNSRHRKDRKALERFSRRDTSVSPVLLPTVTQLTVLRTSCSSMLAFIFTMGSAQ